MTLFIVHSYLNEIFKKNLNINLNGYAEVAKKKLDLSELYIIPQICRMKSLCHFLSFNRQKTGEEHTNITYRYNV